MAALIGIKMPFAACTRAAPLVNSSTGFLRGLVEGFSERVDALVTLGPFAFVRLVKALRQARLSRIDMTQALIITAAKSVVSNSTAST